jgi:hypothetical protein
LPFVNHTSESPTAIASGSAGTLIRPVISFELGSMVPIEFGGSDARPCETVSEQGECRMSLAVGAGSVWALADGCDVARIDPGSGVVTKRYIVCDADVTATASGTGGIAVAFGSLWVTFPTQGVLWRITP